MSRHRNISGSASALLGWLDQGLSLYEETPALRELRDRLIADQTLVMPETRDPIDDRDPQPSRRVNQRTDTESDDTRDDRFKHDKVDPPAVDPDDLAKESTLWYQAHPSLLLTTAREIRSTMDATPECPHYLYVRECSGQLGAIGLLPLSTGSRIKIEVAFPEDFPRQPPRIFFFGAAVGLVASQLRTDGSIPVPAGGGQQWTSAMNCAVAIQWAREWLENTFAIRGAHSS